MLFSSFFLSLQGKPELCGSYHILQSCFLSSSVSVANLSHLVATNCSCLPFLSSSVSMTILSSLVTASFSSLALLSSSVSTANLRCLLVTTFSSLRFLSNSLSSPRFNLLRVARRCYSWSSISDDLFYTSCVFLCSPSCSLFFASYLQPIFLPFFSLRSSVCFKFLFSK